MKRIIALLLTVTVIFSCAAMFNFEKADAETFIGGADWMSKLPADAIIGNLNIPGSHDSGMCWVQLGTENFGSRTQEYPFEEQLDMGVRIFDIRLRYIGDNQLCLCHGSGMVCCDAYETQALAFGGQLTFEKVLKKTADFLNEHRGETVIFTVQEESGNDDDEYIINFDKCLENWKKEYSSLIRETDINGMKNMTMGEARQHIIIPHKMNGERCGFGDFCSTGMNSWNQTAEQKWEAVNDFLNNAKKQSLTGKLDFRAAYTSCTGMDKTILPRSWEIARQMTEHLYSYNFIRGLHYGWISMDRVNPTLAALIYNSNRYNDAYYISELRAFCGDKCGSDPTDIEKAKQACIDAGYKVLDTNGILNVNPLGYPMVLGYKQTLSESDAIKDIVGYYGFTTSCPEGYEKVIVENSTYNYLTRGSGSKTEYVYLAYTKNGSGLPVTDLEWVNAGGSVLTQYGDESWNIGKGTDYYFGLNFYLDGELYPSYTHYSEDRTFYISELRAFCGDSKDASNQNDWNEIKAEARYQGYKLLEKNFINVNPEGYNIALGYKLTDNPYEAITNIVGVYGWSHDEPSGYKCVMLDNALCNYLSDGSGSDSEYTYLYYTYSRDFKPVKEMELVNGEGNVVVYGTGESFNFDAGLDTKIGLNILHDEAFDETSRGLATILTQGSINIIIGMILLILIAIIIIQAVKLRKLKKRIR